MHHFWRMQVRMNSEEDEDRKHPADVMWIEVEEGSGYACMQLPANDFNAKKGVQYRYVLQNAVWNDNEVQKTVKTTRSNSYLQSKLLHVLLSFHNHS